MSTEVTHQNCTLEEYTAIGAPRLHTSNKHAYFRETICQYAFAVGITENPSRSFTIAFKRDFETFRGFFGDAHSNSEIAT